jgi:starch-binding outer membrane protein, SusD/RagB family
MFKQKMMIKLKTIFYALLLLPFLNSCDKHLLETVPNDRISTEIYWKTDKDATLASNAVYTYLEGVSSYFSWDGMSDIGHTNVPFAVNAVVERGQYDTQNGIVHSEWINDYAGIRSANAFLAHVDEVNTTDKDRISRLKAEVKTIRAYLYMKLASLFGDVPLITTEITLQESRTITRTPVNEIWDFIAAELTDAASVLPTSQSEKGRVTKGAALALKARAMLYAGRFQQAADAAKQVMDLNVYTLYPSYQNLFTYAAENNSEVILDKQFVKDVYRNNLFGYMAPYSQQASGTTFVPLKKLVDSYQMNNGKEITDPTSGFDPYNPYVNRDPRLRYSIFVLGDVLPDGKTYNPKPGSGTADAVDYTYLSTKTGFNVKKYINKEDLSQPSNGGINLILIRYAEVLLTYAEAKIELNQLDQSVVDAINLVRQRTDVKMPVISMGSQEALRAAVRHERMVELAFEGLRYIDIRRWRIAENVIPGKIYGMTYTDANGSLQTIEIQSFGKIFDKTRDYLWPIPQKERELNPKLTQNPNW